MAGKDLTRSSSLKRFGSLGDLLSNGGTASDLPPVSWNRSLLYLKPHANRKQSRDFVLKYLKNRKFKVLCEGSLFGVELCDTFDVQYTEISKKAVELEPHECSLSSTNMMEFEKKFKIAWSVAVRKKLVQNSRSCCELLDISPHVLLEAWLESVSSGKMVKLGRGFYCCLIDTIPNKPAVFCINGFFAAMRAEYLAANASVSYFLVEWDNAAMSWDDFRKKVIGSSNPALAHPESLRSVMSTEWEGLGLAGPLDMMRNGLHASASAFEAMVERSLWLGVPLQKDKHFGARLVSSGVPVIVAKEWSVNPLVRGKFVFDHMESQGSSQCLDIAKSLYNFASSGACVFDLPSHRCFVLITDVRDAKRHLLTNSIVFYADTPSSAGELTPVVRMANVRASPSPKVSMMRTSSSGEMKLKPLATGASAAVYPADRARRLPALSPLGNYEACLPDLSLHHVYRPCKLFFETTLLIADYWVCFRYVSFLQLEDRTRRCYPVPPWGRYLSAARAAARS
jgi:hypothetical protein